MRLLEEELSLYFQKQLELEYQRINESEFFTLIVVMSLTIFLGDHVFYHCALAMVHQSIPYRFS